MDFVYFIEVIFLKRDSHVILCLKEQPSLVLFLFHILNKSLKVLRRLLVLEQLVTHLISSSKPFGEHLFVLIFLLKDLLDKFLIESYHEQRIINVLQQTDIPLLHLGHQITNLIVYFFHFLHIFAFYDLRLENALYFILNLLL